MTEKQIKSYFPPYFFRTVLQRASGLRLEAGLHVQYGYFAPRSKLLPQSRLGFDMQGACAFCATSVASVGLIIFAAGQSGS